MVIINNVTTYVNWNAPVGCDCWAAMKLTLGVVLKLKPGAGAAVARVVAAVPALFACWPNTNRELLGVCTAAGPAVAEEVCQNTQHHTWGVTGERYGS